MIDLGKLEGLLGVMFKDRMLLLSAMTHRSYLNENLKHPVPHNERLEFLGDAVLELAITEHIYFQHNSGEGDMTNARSSVANIDHLAEVAEKMGIRPFILMSRGQLRDTSRARVPILGSCLEAIIGAMYLDSGFQVCQEFISRHVLVALPKFVTQLSTMIPKSHLQEVIQEQLGVTPTYTLLECSRLEHEKRWSFSVHAGEMELGRGTGMSKKTAQTEAAQDALKRKVWLQ